MQLEEPVHRLAMGLIMSSNAIASYIVVGLLCVACGSLYWWGLKWRRSDLRFPRGPPGWPVVGHLHIFKELPHQAMAKLAKEYGPIMGLSLGHTRAVIITSPALAREVLLTHDQQFANRPQFEFSSTLYYGGRNDLTFGENGPVWVKLRRMCVSEFLSPRRVDEQEQARQREMDALLQRVRDAGTAPIDIGRFVSDTNSNLLTFLLFSARFPGSSNNHMFRELVKEIEEETVPTLGDFVPWLKFMDFKRKRHMKNLHQRFNRLLDSILIPRKEAMKSMKPHEAPQDFLQALLSKEDGYTTSSKESFTMREIKSLLMDMLLGGILSTTLTIEWAMAELLKNRSCLERLQRELDGVVGKGRKVTNADLPKLPYLANVVKEVLRLHPAAPLLVPRVSATACKVGGYVLPAATQIYINTWAIMRDEQVWDMATTFKPERFENSKLDVKGQHFELLPFGSGRRICLGMPLGLSVAYGTIANLVNNFDWELPITTGKGGTATCLSIDMSEQTGITNNKLHPVMAIPRPLL